MPSLESHEGQIIYRSGEQRGVVYLSNLDAVAFMGKRDHTSVAINKASKKLGITENEIREKLGRGEIVRY